MKASCFTDHKNTCALRMHTRVRLPDGFTVIGYWMGFLDALAPDKETAHSRVFRWLLDRKKEHGCGEGFSGRFATTVNAKINAGTRQK